MANDYDKIFKENIEELFLPMAGKLLQLYPEKLEEIPDDLQITIERKPDFLKKVVHTDTVKDYILHIEFQTEDDTEMVYRMIEYNALLLRKYRLEVKQYVFFIGKNKSKMIDKVSFSDFNFSYQIVNVIDFDYHKFLDSDKAEEIILAILGNFGNKKPQTVAKEVLTKLILVEKKGLKQEKCIIQLEVLSKLRNLQEEMVKQISIMAFTYDLQTDIRYNQGISQGISQGEEKKAVVAIKNMLVAKFPFEQIASIVDVTYDFVKKVADSLKK